MDKTYKLVELLERLHSCKNPKSDKKEEQEFLPTLKSKDLFWAK